MDEAMRQAVETLDRYAGSVTAKGDVLPDPTPLGTVAACRDANGAVISLIPLRTGSMPWRRTAGTAQKLAC